MTNRIGAYLGLTALLSAWLLAFAAVTLAAGEGRTLMPILVPALLLNLALAAATVLVVELLRRHYGRGAAHLYGLWGMLLLDAGVIVLLINHWVAPALEAHQGAVEALRRLGAVYRVSDGWSALCLAGGLFLLSLSLGRVLGARR